MANDITTFKIIIEGSEGTKVVQGSSSNPLAEGTYEVSKVGLGEKLRTASKAAGVSIAVDIVKDAAQFATSHIGDYTGNSALQNNINIAMEHVNNVSMMLLNPLAGTANVFTNMLLKHAEYLNDYYEDYNSVSAYRERAGLHLYRGRKG